MRVFDKTCAVGAAFKSCRRHFMGAAAFSAVSNLLFLTPSILMLQVYDRVLPTGGLATLAALAGIALVALVSLSAFEWLRSRLLIRASLKVEASLAGPALTLAMNRGGLSRLERVEVMQHVDTLRQAVASPAMIALFDLPWAPIYVIVAFLLHPALGALAVGSSVVLLALAWENERATSRKLRKAASATAAAQARQNQAIAHSAEIRALGMVEALTRLQQQERNAAHAYQVDASFAGNSRSNLIKLVRLIVQSGALVVAAILAVQNAISAGAIIAASLLIARSLAPVEQIVGAWKTIVSARTAYAQLSEKLGNPSPVEHTQLPKPTGALSCERVTVVNPLTERVAIADVSFVLQAGSILGVMGQSGAGKTTLLRAIAGATELARGHVRFDGASRTDWNPEALARFVGFLPQDFVPFPGTIKENIAHFRGALGEDPAQIDTAVVTAAQSIGAHEMILHLPNGYETQVGANGIGLSAGQAQRIAIARALFDAPPILVMDEPTAHLDAEAQLAFQALIGQLRMRGVTLVFASHSTELLACADQFLVMKEGRAERLAAANQLRPRDTEPVRHPVTFNPWKAS